MTPRGDTGDVMDGNAYPMCECGHRHDHHRDDGDPRGGGCTRADCSCKSYTPAAVADRAQRLALDLVEAGDAANVDDALAKIRGACGPPKAQTITFAVGEASVRPFTRGSPPGVVGYPLVALQEAYELGRRRGGR